MKEKEYKDRKILQEKKENSLQKRNTKDKNI